MSINFNPEFTVANLITIVLALALGLSAWNSVEGQVSQNQTAINESKQSVQKITTDLAELKIDVALLKKDSEHASEMMEEIKANQTHIIKLLSDKG
tara:strand:- start:202 stop:489 length:288 start_codon:yes stop_codon:yes gene_type:complete